MLVSVVLSVSAERHPLPNTHTHTHAHPMKEFWFHSPADPAVVHLPWGITGKATAKVNHAVTTRAFRNMVPAGSVKRLVEVRTEQAGSECAGQSAWELLCNPRPHVPQGGISKWLFEKQKRNKKEKASLAPC